SNLQPQLNKSPFRETAHGVRSHTGSRYNLANFQDASLKLHLSQAAGRNLVTAYGPGYVSVNHQRYEHSLIIMPEELIADWPPAAFTDLQPEHLTLLADRNLEVVLIGTGPKLRFP